MSIYYVNKRAQSNGDHEVHTHECKWLPLEENRHMLGVFTSCLEAVREAKKIYRKSNGCAHCCRVCHTS
ncbi:hypothetical protein CGK66_14285 [Vibrio parahaemolyticus]|nr:hypothetical protein AOR10_01945 [Vibrio alginolyticus]TNY56382.1 hypothetical protein CGK66_14285 [Vibrio parahaemolyticus]